jgi:hypothetical protein
MPHLLKIALLTVLGFIGGALAFAGVHFWSATHRTVITMFDAVPADGGSEVAGSCGTPDPLLDWRFLLQRTAAAMILVFGVTIFCWAVRLMLMKKAHDSMA